MIWFPLFQHLSPGPLMSLLLVYFDFCFVGVCECKCVAVSWFLCILFSKREKKRSGVDWVRDRKDLGGVVGGDQSILNETSTFQ